METSGPHQGSCERANMALMRGKYWVGGRVTKKRTAYCWLSVLTFLLAACQMPGAVRKEEGPLLVAGSGRLQFPGWVRTLAFSHGGRMLMAGGCEAGGNSETPCARGLVTLWNLKDMTSEAIFRFPKAITAMAVSPDGTKWVVGDSEGRLILSTTAEKGLPLRPLHQRGEITALAFSPEGQWVASGSLDASFPLGLIEMKTEGVIKVKAHFAPVSAVAFARDGKTLGIGMQNGSVVAWNFTSRESPSPIMADGVAKQPISSLAFSPDDRLLAYGRQDGRVVIVDRASGQVTLDIRRSSAVTALGFSPNGRYLALGQDNGKVTLIESEGGYEVWAKRHIISVADLAYSPDGTSLAVAVQQRVFIYQLGDADSMPGSLPQTERMTKTSSKYMVVPNPRQTRSGDVSSRRFSRVLQVSQDEYFWLLPFDRLIFSSVEAMQRVVPGAVVERGGSTMSGQLRLAAGGRSLSIDLNRLRRVEGRTGLHEAVQAYESAQRVLLAAWPGAATVLEETAISAVLAELGPGVRLVPQPKRGMLVQERRDLTKKVAGEGSLASHQIAEEAVLGGGVRYLKLAGFGRSSANRVQRWATRGTDTQEQSTAHILDLRDNAGGDLDSAVETAENLLPKGQVIAELIARKTGERIQYRSKGVGHVPRSLVVLVNERTAGTAELLACAIRESGAGVLVGTGTSGVDEVYGLFPLPGGDALRVSTGRFFCPGEQSLRWKGQPVDVEVGRVSSATDVPVAVSQADAFSRPRWASLLPAGFPVMADHQLRIGVEVAMCISHGHFETRIAAPTSRRVEGAGNFPGACRMSSR